MEDAENEYDPTGFVQSRNNENRLPSANPALEEPLIADRYDKDPGAVGIFHVRVQHIINCFPPWVKGTKRWWVKPDQRLFCPADNAQIDTGRQAFSVYFDEDGDAYRFEVSAPDNRSFDSVWDTVGHWLKYQADHEWSEENLEFAIKAFGRANSMRFLRLIKETDMEIIPVAEYEDMDES